MVNPAFTLAAIASLAWTSSAVQWAGEKVPYKKGDVVPVTCLNRTIDTGEHVSDAAGNLQYIPFPTCSETKHPLSFSYLSSKPQNCTITLTDPLFHLLEFYIHNDAPLTCRLPILHASHGHTMSPGGAHKSVGQDLDVTDAEDYVPLVIGLAGQLQKSHLHVANRLNVIVHTGASTAKKKAGRLIGAVDSASGYSVSPLTRNTRIVIGDELTFEFAVKWYEGPTLGVTSSTGGGWFMPMLFGVVVGFVACWGTVKGLELPKSLQRMLGSRNDVLPKYNGYGYGIGSGVGSSSNGGMRKGD